MASFTQRDFPKSSVTSKSKSVVRPSNVAPVLFSIPNLRIDPAVDRQPRSDDLATSRSVTTSTQIAGSVSLAAESPSRLHGVETSPPHNVATPTSTPTAPILATAFETPFIKTEEPPKPSYTPEPKPVLAAEPAANGNAASKSWYAGWSNRFIILLLVALIFIFGFRSMNTTRSDGTTEWMERQGLVEATLDNQVELPSPLLVQTTPSGSIHSPSLHDEPSEGVGATTPSNEANALTGEIELSPQAHSPLNLGTHGTKDVPTASLQPSTTQEEGFDRKDAQGNDRALLSESLIENPTPENATVSNSAAMNSHNANDLQAPSLLLNEKENKASPSIAETEYEALQTEQLLAARKAWLNSNKNSGSQEGVPYRMASTGVQNVANYGGSPQAFDAPPTTQFSNSQLQGNSEISIVGGYSSPTPYGNAPINGNPNLLGNNQGLSNPSTNSMANPSTNPRTSDTMVYRPVGVPNPVGHPTLYSGTQNQLTGSPYPPETVPHPAIAIPSPSTPTSGPMIQGSPSIPSALNGTTSSAATTPRRPYQPILNSVVDPNGQPTMYYPPQSSSPQGSYPPQGSYGPQGNYAPQGMLPQNNNGYGGPVKNQSYGFTSPMGVPN